MNTIAQINAFGATFMFFFAAMVATVGYLFKGVLLQVAAQAQEHAQYYAVAYVKCFALCAIATGACFTETFWSLTKADTDAYQWWNWMILFWKPIAAGMATLLAFLDRSSQTATAKKDADTKAPFTPPTT